VGRRVVVIGGGMTAVDVAVQSKLLGAQDVALVYRRDKDSMSASVYEQELATSKGVRIIYNAQPLRVLQEGAGLSVEFAYTETQGGSLTQTGETFCLPADQVFKAIGQSLTGKIKVDANGRTSAPKVWAGGDCATGGDDLTVTAVAEGRDAALDIHTTLLG
jgi:glutamate synthase (NADPH/NADH) small chain